MKKIWIIWYAIVLHLVWGGPAHSRLGRGHDAHCLYPDGVSVSYITLGAILSRRAPPFVIGG